MNSVVFTLYMFFAIESALMGIIIGSFLNVIIYRTPEGRTVVKGHSMCMSCGHTLAAKDLVPLFSWLFLKGKCRYCGAPVPSRYAKIESFTGLVFLIAAIARIETIFIVVTPILFYISLAINFVLFLTACCCAISAMMIYHDTGKGFIKFAITSVVCGLISTVLNRLNVGTTAKSLTIAIIIPVALTVVCAFLFKSLFLLFKKPYGKYDLFADLTLLGILFNSDFTTLFTNIYGINKAMTVEVLIYAVVYGLLRAGLKNGKKDKVSVIYGFLIIVILVVLRYSIMSLIYKY